MKLKYSIVVPSRNGGEYLKSCVNTIISQDYDNYELIISDDHSTDGTKEYLNTLKFHPNIKVIEPDEPLSMTEHWEWALSHATGEWQIFVGQDDGLQPYFFKLSDQLTKIANKKMLRSIMSARAYYFWEGCEPVYGDVAVSYSAPKKIKIKIHHSAYEASKALLGFQNYFELPEMYTTSLFHKSLLDEARQKQEGKVLTCHPQDANLGVIACSLEKYYLRSSVPLGWVGSSPKSAGMAINSANKRFENKDADNLKDLEAEYTQKIKNSKIKYNILAGNFSFNDTQLYFWQAFLETSSLRSKEINRVFISKSFKYILFSSVQTKLWTTKTNQNKIQGFRTILSINQCSLGIIRIVSVFIINIRLLNKSIKFVYRVSRKIFKIILKPTVEIHYNRSNHKNLSMKEASEIVVEKMDQYIVEL